MKEINVLVTGLGGPIAQGIMMALETHNHVNIIGVDCRELTSGHHFADKTYQIPKYSDLKAYKEAIKEIIEKENIHAIFPALPEEISIYKEFRHELDIPVALPKEAGDVNLENKVDVYEFLEVRGLEHYLPEYSAFHTNEELHHIMTHKFQDDDFVVVKMAETYGAIGLSILTSRENYLDAFSKNKKKYIATDDYYDIEEFEGAHRFVMPLIDAPEYSVDLYLNDGEVVVAVPRERTGTSNGIVLEGKVVENQILSDIASEIAQSIVTDGFINLQFFETDGEYKLIDINPRFAGSQVMSLGAGVNFPYLFLQYNVLNEKAEVNPEWDTVMFRYRVPIFYSK